MVKADLTRDYYGDLELQPGADTAEIKRQFKKLGTTSDLTHSEKAPLMSGPQLSLTTQTEILAARTRSLPNSKRYNLRTKSSPTHKSEQNMTAVATKPQLAASEVRMPVLLAFEGILGRMSAHNIHHLQSPQLPADLPHNHRLAPNATRTLRRPSNLHTKPHKKEQEPGRARTRHGSI